MKPHLFLATSMTLLLLGTTLLQPVVAEVVETCSSHGISYNCVTDVVQEDVAHIPYEDGSFGNASVNQTDTVFTTSWPQTLTTEMGNVFTNATSGVQMGAVHELHATFNTQNSTVGTAGSHEVIYLGSLTNRTMVPVFNERIQFHAENIMNGASRFTWRSPISWDVNYTSHALVVRDAGTNEIIGGDLYVAGGGHIAGGQGAVVNNRIYHVVEAAIRTSRAYVFEEFVGIPASLPGIAHLNVSLANGADLAGDGNRESFLFAGTNAALSFAGDEAAWSIVFQRGIGDAGIERLAIGNTSQPNVRVLSDLTPGAPNANPNTIELLIPLRTSVPLDVHVKLNVVNVSASVFDEYEAHLENVTGIAMANITIAQTGVNNSYFVEFSFNLTEGEAMTYVMIEGRTGNGPLGHTVLTCESDDPTAFCDSQFPQFGPWFEVHEAVVASPPAAGTSSDHSFHLTNLLLGAGEIILGAALDAAGVIVAFIASPTVVAVLFGSALVAGGSVLVAHGAVNIAYGAGFINDDEYQKMSAAILHVGKDLLGIAATGACIVSLLAAPAVVSVPVCILAAVADLWALDIPIFQIIKNAIETTAYWIGVALQFFVNYVLPVLGFLAVVVLAMLAITGVVAVGKYVALLILSAFVLFMPSVHRPREWEPFRRVHDLYLPIYSDLIERRLFHMEVHA